MKKQPFGRIRATNRSFDDCETVGINDIACAGRRQGSGEWECKRCTRQAHRRWLNAMLRRHVSKRSECARGEGAWMWESSFVTTPNIPFPLPMFAHLLFSITLFHIPFFFLFGARAGHGNGIIIIFLCIENETELASKHATCYNSKSCTKKNTERNTKKAKWNNLFFSFLYVWVASVPRWNTRWFLFHFLFFSY